MAETPPTPPTPPPAGPPPIPAPSGPPPVPAELQGGWNWGAFFLSWIWAIAHRSVLGFVLAFFLGIIGAIILGIKGNEWGWQSGRFETVQQFKDTQRVWAKWGLIIFLASIVLLVLFWGAIMALFVAGAVAEGMG